MGKRTVVHFLPTFDTGGLGSLAMEMIRAWPEKEVRHIVVAPQYLRTKPDLFFPFIALVGQGNVAQVRRSFAESPTVYRDTMAGQLRKMQVGHDVSHAINYNFTDHIWNGSALRLCGYPKLPIICHVGTVLPDEENVRLAARSVLAERTVFVPASKAVSASLTVAVGEFTSRIHPVIWNGVDVQRFASARRVPATRARVFGFSGRMALPAVKDWPMLLEGFTRCLISDAELHIAGDGPLLNALCIANPRVNFLGNVKSAEMPDFLGSLDAFIMAALPIEGFSMALVEAIASGCLILGSDVASVREVFEAGEGTVFLARDAEHLARNMNYLFFSKTAAEKNAAMVAALSKKLDAATMARAYWEIQ